MTKRCLVTGGAGFFGSHLVDYLYEHTDWTIIIWDALTYASRQEVNGKAIPWRLPLGLNHTNRIKFYHQDVRFPEHSEDVDYIVHLAAETHVENSIKNPLPFIETNVYGTYEMLELARNLPNLEKFLYFSTDEVFGEAEEDPFTEWARYNSSNPYAATKAAGEELALAWSRTYGVPVVITHCCNIFGEKQHEEKFIPKLVRQILNGETVKIHCNRYTSSFGSRQYIYAGDAASAVLLILQAYTEHREKFNIPGLQIDNLGMVIKVAHILGKSGTFKPMMPLTERPGWDMHYSIAGNKLQSLGWKPSDDFLGLLRKTVESLCPAK